MATRARALTSELAVLAAVPAAGSHLDVPRTILLIAAIGAVWVLTLLVRPFGRCWLCRGKRVRVVQGPRRPASAGHARAPAAASGPAPARCTGYAARSPLAGRPGRTVPDALPRFALRRLRHGGGGLVLVVLVVLAVIGAVVHTIWRQLVEAVESSPWSSSARPGSRSSPAPSTWRCGSGPA